MFMDVVLVTGLWEGTTRVFALFRCGMVVERCCGCATRRADDF